jgi:hypothetical protein
MLFCIQKYRGSDLDPDTGYADIIFFRFLSQCS